MSEPVELPHELMAAVRREADLQGRSTAEQVAHWLRIGRAIETSGSYDHARVTAALEGQLDTVDLSEIEQAVWLEAFTSRMSGPSEIERRFFAERRKSNGEAGVSASQQVYDSICPRGA